MGSCDLNRIFGQLASNLPEDTELSEPYLLDRTNTPTAPLEIASEQLVGRKSFIQRLPGCRGDYVDLIAPGITFRQLGLLFLSVVLHEQNERVVLHLANPKSALKYLVFRCVFRGFGGAGLRSRPDSFGYRPQEVTTFQTDEERFGAPVLRLTNLKDCQEKESDWLDREVLNIDGGGMAFAELGGFFLDAGRPDAKIGHFSIPANHAFFATEIGLWTPEQWEDFRRRLTQEPPENERVD